MITAGILTVYLLGAELPRRGVAGLGAGLHLLLAALATTLHQSPLWLLRQGQPAKAKQALAWLGRETEFQQEVQNSIVVQRSENMVLQVEVELAERLERIVRGKAGRAGALLPLFIIGAAA